MSIKWGGKIGRDEKPEVFATGEGGSVRYVAYDLNTYDVCCDPDCNCRRSAGNATGYGETPEQALAAFWEDLELREDR